MTAELVHKNAPGHHLKGEFPAGLDSATLLYSYDQGTTPLSDRDVLWLKDQLRSGILWACDEIVHYKDAPTPPESIIGVKPWYPTMMKMVGLVTKATVIMPESA
jgi:hypothetical protein